MSTLAGDLQFLTRQSAAVVTVEQTDLVINLLHLACEEMKRDQEVARAHVFRAVKLLREGSARTKGAGAKSQGCLAPWQRRAVEIHIDRHLDGSIRVQDLAAVARLSSRYFTVVFKREFGETPHAYLSRRRIVRAMEMMLDTDEPLSIIAAACGLTDQSHLCRLFRKTQGMSPARWRRHRRDGAEDAAV
jgi:AraC family transcriptional regulator